MHILLCPGKPDDEKELCVEKDISAFAVIWGADADGCCHADLCVGHLVISRGTIMWLDGNAELQLVLTILALGSQVALAMVILALK